MAAALMAARGLMTFWPVYFGGAPAHRLEHRRAFGVDVATGRDAETALNHRRQIGDDVAEHVVGHDDVEPFRIFHEPHADGINV